LVNYHIFWFGDVNVICNRKTKTYSVACIKQTSVEKYVNIEHSVVCLCDLFVDAPEKPKFDHRSRIFELDACDGNCKVCLVYRGTKLGLFTLHLCHIFFW